jgi:hypothetical protein
VRRALAVVLLQLVVPQPALAWPAETMTALSRDARKLLPRSLNRLLGERESFVLDETRRFPPDLARALAQDLPSGRLSQETLDALAAHADAAFRLLKDGQVTEGLVRLGGLLRIPADLSDPVLVVGPEGWPAGLTREYYALFAANLGKMPVVLDDRAALKLTRKELPALWQSLVERSRVQVPVMREALFVGGPAATWLAVWREANGDTTRMPTAREVVPQPQPEGP